MSRTLVVLGALLLIAPPTPAAPSHPGAFLRLGNYYVLYTHPVAPFLDSRGSMMIVADVVPRMMGLDVRDGSLPRSVLLTQGPVALEMTAGVGSATVIRRNGSQGPAHRQIIPLASRPQFHASGKIIIPVRPLMEAFGITGSWQPDHRVLALPGIDLAKDPGIELLEGQLAGRGTTDTDKLVPVSFHLSRVTRQGISDYKITFDLLNVSKGDIHEGQQAVYTVTSYESGPVAFGGGGIWTLPDSGSRRKDPCSRSTNGFRCTVYAPGKVSQDETFIEFIVMRTRRR